MSEDTDPMNTPGRHGGYETVELDPTADSTIVDSVDTVDAGDVDLSTDPFADDLSAELAARAPRRYATRVTTVLAGLVLVAGGFLAGAQVQKNFGTPAAGSTRGRTAPTGAGSGLAGGGSFGGGVGGQRQGAAAQPSAAAANVTTGAVKLVDGATVYVQTANGDVLTVRTNGSTAVQITRSGALTDLAPGTQVSVEGAASGDGVVTATKVAKVG